VLERTLEIALSRYPGILDPDWELVGQQVAMPVGILDLLFKDKSGVLQLVEVKKAAANEKALAQVLRYTEYQRSHGNRAVPWIVAHSIPPSLAERAKELGVRTRAITVEECEEALRLRGTDLARLAPLRQRTTGALTGGNADLWRTVEHVDAFREMPSGFVAYLKRLLSTPGFTLRSGAMQTVIWYRGVKLGGVNRKHRGGVGYVTSGVLTPALRKQLVSLGFRWMEKRQTSGHVHTWMEISIDTAESFAKGMETLRLVVDGSLGAKSSPATEPKRGE
jgi:Endonuclease NucS